LRQARLAGCSPIAGLAMLVYQAAAQQLLWTGREPPIDTMMAAAAAELTRRD
jgi:shikimate 5-dehydrogenase